MDTINAKEAGNYQATKAMLGDSFPLAQAFSDHYLWLINALEAPAQKLDIDAIVAIKLAMSCQYALHMALLSLLRGHGADPLQHVRKAAESCAFATRIRKHPHLGFVWLEAGKDRSAYLKFKTAFETKKLFPATDPLLQDLFQKYDLASKSLHNSIYSHQRPSAMDR